MGYISTPAGAIDGLMKRTFAPPKERLESVVARLKATPAILKADARRTSQNPPEGIRRSVHPNGRGFGRLLQGRRLHLGQGRGRRTDAALTEGIRDGQRRRHQGVRRKRPSWLKKDLLPKADGKFPIGADNFTKQLLYEEMVDIPLDKLLAIGEANLAKDYAAFAATAKLIDPTKTPAEVMKKLSDEHPTEADLIPSAKRTIEKIRSVPHREEDRHRAVRSAADDHGDAPLRPGRRLRIHGYAGRLRDEGDRSLLLRDADRRGIGTPRRRRNTCASSTGR